jgi:RNA polymerase sigma-70 factor (ECF subfamily)
MSLPSDVVQPPPPEADPASSASDGPSSGSDASHFPAPIGVVRRDFAEASDAELMQMIGAGDRAAFSVFCRRHAARCLSIAQHLLRDSADAEEVVQDVFLRVWQNAGRLRNKEARPTTWLYRVVVNLCLDQMRRAKRLSVSLDHAAEVVASGPSPENIVGQREMARIIGRAVANLPPRQRAALSLVVSEGLEYTEAARIMEVSVSTIESLLVRGRRQLRAALAEAVRDPTGAPKAAPTATRSDNSSEPVAPPFAALSRVVP